MYVCIWTMSTYIRIITFPLVLILLAVFLILLFSTIMGRNYADALRTDVNVTTELFGSSYYYYYYGVSPEPQWNWFLSRRQLSSATKTTSIDSNKDIEYKKMKTNVGAMTNAIQQIPATGYPLPDNLSFERGERLGNALASYSRHGRC